MDTTYDSSRGTAFYTCEDRIIEIEIPRGIVQTPQQCFRESALADKVNKTSNESDPLIRT